ncbi:MAG TPA: TonB-dependent receptor, partial [Thermodesulfobacteriota bacterium]|nr:TonB-dependent receptor [Thermodesulfobacteriota bacterium]
GEPGAAGREAGAATPEPGGPPARLEPVVVTATRIEQPASQLGSSVTVISGEELRQRGIVFVSDALQEVPGATAPRSGTRGKLTSLFLRGANSNQTVVLIDGVRVNDPVGGGFDFSSLTTDDVERIEVIRGPQSTLYGSEAIGGVVNIVTRRGRGPVRTTVAGHGGNFGTWRLGAAIEGGNDLLSGSVEGSRFETANRFENDDFRIGTLSGRLGARLADGLSATAVFRRSAAEGGIPGQVAFGPPALTDRQATELAVGALDLDYRTTPIWRQRLSLARTDRALEFTSGGFTSVTESVRRAVEWVHTLTPLPALSLVAGGEYRSEAGSGFVAARRVERALFALAEVRALGERLFVQGGARLDDGTAIRSELSPKIAGAFLLPATGTRLHASWGEGIKAPTILDLFFPGFSNPALVPERSTGWDAGVDQQLWSQRVELGATYFRNDFRDLIVFDPALLIPVNVGRAHSSGVETTLTLRPAGWLEAGLAYTYLVARDDETGARLLRRPRHQGSARITVRPVAGGAATLSGLYVGSRRDVFAGGAAAELGGYVRLDASATYRLARVPGVRSLELLGRVENLLDREYQEVAGFPALGTSLLAGVRGTF